MLEPSSVYYLLVMYIFSDYLRMRQATPWAGLPGSEPEGLVLLFLLFLQSL